MKNVLRISTVLTWINMLIGGFLTIKLVVESLMIRNLSLVIMGFLLSSIVLHSYAALQLRKSIVRPERPLNGHTPTGIRLIGAVALFFGMLFIAVGIAVLQNPSEILKMMQDQIGNDPELTAPHIRWAGLIVLLAGLSIALNVMLNFRLLRWYYFMKGMM